MKTKMHFDFDGLLMRYLLFAKDKNILFFDSFVFNMNFAHPSQSMQMMD